MSYLTSRESNGNNTKLLGLGEEAAVNETGVHDCGGLWVKRRNVGGEG